MCNDFERNIEWEAYCAAMDAASLGMPATSNAAQLPPAIDVRVGDETPVIRAVGNVAELTLMRWGFPPARPGGAPVFNFRSEGRRFAKADRCLVPASAFFEFTGKISPKCKWRFGLANSPLLAVAGLWRSGVDKVLPAFTMLTTSPGPDIEPFHTRQIVVLNVEDWAGWLYLDRPEAELLKPLPRDSLVVSLARRGREEPDPRLLARTL